MATPNNVGAAIAQAQQFMPQASSQEMPSFVNINPSVGLQSNQDTGDVELAKALGVSALALTSYAEEKQKQQKEVADAVAPLVYGMTDEKTRQISSASDLIAKSGQTFLQDNPYATALINHLQGQELAQDTFKKYQVYSSQFDLKDNMAEEVQSFDQFVDAARTDYLAKTTPDNMAAFTQGFSFGRVAATGANSQSFADQKETQMGIVRSQTLLGWADGQTRQMLNSSAETQQKFVDTLSQMYKMTQFRDPSKGYDLIKAVMQVAAKNTGNLDLIDKLGKMTYQEGTVADYFDISAVKDIAINTAQQLRLKGFQNLSDTLGKAKSKKDLYDTYNKMTPDQQRIVSPQLGHFESSIEAADRERKRAALMMQKNTMKAAVSQTGAAAQIKAIAAGGTTDSFGRQIAMSASDLQNMGIDKETFLGQMTNYIASQGINFYNSEEGSRQLTNLIMNPLGKESFSTVLQNSAVSGLTSIGSDGSYNDSFTSVLQFYQKSPGLFNELVSDEKTRMGVFIVANMGTDKYLASQQALNDSDTMNNYSTQLAGDGVTGPMPTKLGQIDLDNFADGSSAAGLTDVASGSNSVEFRNRAVMYAKAYMASGLDANSAAMSAVDQMKREYYSFEGAPIPKSVTNLVGSDFDEDDRRSAFYWEMKSAFDNYCSTYGVSSDLVQVSYNPRQGGNALITFSNGAKSQQLSVAQLASSARADLQEHYSSDSSDSDSSDTTTYTATPAPVYEGVQANEDYVNKTGKYADDGGDIQPGDYVY